MQQRIHSFTFIILFIVTGTSYTWAQNALSKWQVGVNGGILIYQGDLTPSDIGSYSTMKPVVGVYVSRVLNPSFLLRTNIAFGKLYGNDASYDIPSWRKERNFTFTSPMLEISELLVWNMYSNNGNELGKRFSPYLFAGAGISLINVSRDYSRFNNTYFATNTKILNGLSNDIKRTPPRAALIIPLGIGTEIYLIPKLSLTAETNFRYTFTDYLDGFSLAANPEKKDFYHSHTVGLLYRFGKSNEVGCPVIKH